MATEDTMALSEPQYRLLMSLFPRGSRITEVVSYRPGYRFLPARVRVAPPNGCEQCVVLKEDRGAGTETMILPVLERLGLPVPQVLAGPVPGDTGAGTYLLNVMPGEPLPFWDASAEELDLTCRLLIEGVERLHALTDALVGLPEGQMLPSTSLSDELEAVEQRGGPWMGEGIFSEALERLRSTVHRAAAPMVFTSGDYNSLNFLCRNGRLTAFIDFGQARFEDPHIGFARFMIWSRDRGWAPLARVGVVERWLYRRNVTRNAFAVRLAIRCLTMLQTEISVKAKRHDEYRAHVTHLLAESLECLEA